MTTSFKHLIYTDIYIYYIHRQCIYTICEHMDGADTKKQTKFPLCTEFQVRKYTDTLLYANVTCIYI